MYAYQWIFSASPINSDSIDQYGDSAGNTVEENSSVFSLIRMR